MERGHFDSISGVFESKYLSFYLAKIEKSGQFGIARVMQILELSLLFIFGQVEAEVFGQIQTRGRNKMYPFQRLTLYVTSPISSMPAENGINVDFI